MIRKRAKRLSRQSRVRRKIKGTGKMPRLSVFKSNKHIYAQLIDDEARQTLAAFSDQKLADIKSDKISKIEIAEKVGTSLAKIAAKKKIVKVVFDRGGHAYHGIVKAFAESLRKGGLEF